jgi:hypothetical protein
MKMIVSELIRTLRDMDPEAEVRLAFQPNFPLSYDIGDVVEHDGVVHLVQGDRGQYASREIFE